MLQERVGFEAAGVIGLERYERTEDRVTERNDTRPKLLATKAGYAELRIPKLRKGSFFPSILGPRRRIDQVAVRGGDGSLRPRRQHAQCQLSWSSRSAPSRGVSNSEVSRICEQLADAACAFCLRHSMQLTHRHSLGLAVRKYVDDNVRPHIAGWFESASIPARELAKELGDLGVLDMRSEWT